MHILYVDESGDDGFPSSGVFVKNQTPTQYYIKAGLVIHDLKWNGINKSIENFKQSFKIPIDMELHAANIFSGRDRVYINKKPIYRKNWFGNNFPKKKDRFEILKNACDLIAKLDLELFFMRINKAKIKTSVFGYTTFPKLKSWEFLIERYNLFLMNQVDQKGIIISDAITSLIEKDHRKFARAIYTNSFHVQKYHFIESILFEPSESSNLLQFADIAAYACGRDKNAGNNILFKIIEHKIYSYNGVRDGCGIKDWPE